MIYFDDEYKCHASNPDGTYREIETKLFDGKCACYIEGYRYIPAGVQWTRQDGAVLSGEMAFPWKDWEELDKAQRQYEKKLIVHYEQALSEIEQALGVTT